MNRSKTAYDNVAKMLHWLIALAIIGMLVLGWLMTSDTIANGPSKFAMFQWHKSVGITILALSLLRLLWRFANPPPPLPPGMKKWEIAAAKITHILFYVLIIALPLVGWMMVSLSSFKTVLYGFLPLPNLPLLADMENKKELKELLEDMHGLLAYMTVALLALHIGAAGKHHLINRDDVLLRMAPKFAARFLEKIRSYI